MDIKHDWKLFERLVTAIHISESQGAKVTWNEKTNGRQFDVVIRFKHGIYHYLTVIECKNYKEKIPVEKVEAFITKTKDINANKAILISSSGFQSGCVEVARRYGIKLLTLNEKVTIDPNYLVAEIIPALNIYDVRLILSDSDKEYPLAHVCLKTGIF